MRCPYCSHEKDRVVDSREGKTGDVVRRRRECLSCRRRFTTYERAEDIPFTVVKKDGTREQFDPLKLRDGLLKACEKRGVPSHHLDHIIEVVEQKFNEPPGRELTSEEIGQCILDQLRQTDKIAYLRFASVHLDFQDLKAFTDLVDQLGHG